MSKEIISKLEVVMDTIIDIVSSELRKEAMTVELLHQEELEKHFQLQEKELRSEFEKKVSLAHKLNQEETENQGP
jgi:hypothetical protein